MKPASSVHARAFDDELVILDLARGEYYALDPIGASLWHGLESGRTVQEVAQSIVNEYEVELAQVLADLERLKDELLRRRLLVLDEADE